MADLIETAKRLLNDNFAIEFKPTLQCEWLLCSKNSRYLLNFETQAERGLIYGLGLICCPEHRESFKKQIHDRNDFVAGSLIETPIENTYIYQQVTSKQNPNI
jgi:hypothetical protein